MPPKLLMLEILHKKSYVVQTTKPLLYLRLQYIKLKEEKTMTTAASHLVWFSQIKSNVFPFEETGKHNRYLGERVEKYRKK